MVGYKTSASLSIRHLQEIYKEDFFFFNIEENPTSTIKIQITFLMSQIGEVQWLLKNQAKATCLAPTENFRYGAALHAPAL